MSILPSSASVFAFLAACICVYEKTAASGVVVENSYVRVTRCSGQALASGHRYRTLSVRSVLDCVGHCQPTRGCLSVVFDKDSGHCHLGDATAARDCHNMELVGPGVQHVELLDPCLGHREVLGPDGTCVCDKGFRGTPCQPYIADCTEGYASGNFTSNWTHNIHPLNAPQPFQVFCRLQGDIARTYIMERRDSTLDFDRNFLDYQNGFGDLLGDHWLGLEKIHQLTSSKNYELRVSVRIYNDSSYFQKYQNFVVTEASSGYRLFFSSTTPDTLLGDCLTPLNGSKFSAFDNDSDESPLVNCAAKHAGGFWFRGGSCSTCNPTGLLVMPYDGLRYGVDNEAFWTNDLGNLAPFKVSMYLVAL